jgi:hypothetical protein
MTTIRYEELDQAGTPHTHVAWRGPGGAAMFVPADTWRNESRDAVTLMFGIGTPTPGADGKVPPHARATHIRVTVAPGETVRLPSDVRAEIHQGECAEPECALRRSFCRNAAHRKKIVGGQGTALRIVGEAAPEIHPVLVASAEVPRPTVTRSVADNFRARVRGAT